MTDARGAGYFPAAGRIFALYIQSLDVVVPWYILAVSNTHDMLVPLY